MAYLKKKYREKIKRMDKELKIPKGWYYFVKKELNKDGLLIKSKGICECTNCKTKFETSKKINEYEKCPKCKNEYLIKRSNCKWYDFYERTLILLDKLDNDIVIRLFAIYSRYSNGKMYHSKATEYGRILMEDDIHLCNNRLRCYAWGNYKVYYGEKIKSWKEFADGRSELSTRGEVFYKNVKDVLKGTEFEHSQLWTLLEKEKDVDIKYYLKHNYPSTEMLIKMGLYKLALCPATFNKKGSFDKRFGINKSYYKFMKENNIDIDELNVLKLYKKPDIEIIKFLKSFSIEALKEIMEYETLDKFVSYTKFDTNFDIDLYKDYLGFLKTLRLDYKNNKYLFPENLKIEHDKLSEQIEMKKSKKVSKKIKKRYQELEKNIYFDKKYIIFPAKSITALEDESKQQSNCVRTYAERYSDGMCDIYFMRNKKEPDKSLVTVEVNHNKIVQSRTKFNNKVNASQKKFLEQWENKILKAA